MYVLMLQAQVLGYYIMVRRSFFEGWGNSAIPCAEVQINFSHVL